MTKTSPPSVGWKASAVVGKSDEEGVAGHIGAAARIDGDPLAEIDAASAQVGGVGEHGVDDQRPRGVVAAEAEADAIATEQIAGRHRPPAPVDRLVHTRSRLRHGTAGNAHDKAAAGVNAQPVGAAQGEPDPSRVGSGRHDQVVLEPPLAAIEASVTPRYRWR